MYRPLFALPVLAASSWSVAQEPPAVDLVARLMAGAADQAWIFTDYLLAKLEQTGPGAFVGDSSGERLELSVTEPETCIFDLSTTFAGSNPGRVRLDARALTSVSYRTSETVELEVTLTGYFVTLEGGPDLLTLPDSTGADGRPQVAPRELYWMTSLELAALEGALRDLQTLHCPPSGT